MGYDNFISECEAATIAGVSTSTLNRFAEAGYLRIEIDADGLRLFSKKELGDVFGISNKHLTKKIQPSLHDATQNNLTKPKPQPTQVNEIAEDELSRSTIMAQEEEVVGEVITEDPHTTTAFQMVEEVEQVCQSEDVWSDRSYASSSFPNLNEAAASISASFVEQEPSIPSDEPDNDSAGLKQEITKYKNIVRLQEQVLDMRDKELEDLRQQRQWLQARIEKLEEKSDRDQLLLLSEKQVVRQLLTHNQKKASPLRAALEWIGFVPDNPQDSNYSNPRKGS
ncbi:hypothetical protein OAO01_04225 [Oligoflexia bacterium]|nr:hypothetical protein [Oligoflexia bacterium]